MKSEVNDSESKRLQAFSQMINRHKQHKSAIHASLTSVDSKPKNRIVFDEDGAQSSTDFNNSDTTANSTKNSKPLLGSDEEPDEEFNFEYKKQFEGPMGHKLLALKSKYHNDERFTFDERFIDESGGGSEITQNGNNFSVDEEKQKELQILGSVLGDKNLKFHDQNERRKEKAMVRFDPARPEHSKYLVNVPEVDTSTKKKKKKDKKLREVEENMEIDQPVVSKEIFHKVSDNLKETLEEKQQFSLLSMFGRDKEENEEADEAYSAEIQTKTKNFGRNPFRYDSSSDEENEDTAVKKIPEPETVNRPQLWNEPFFFLEGDSRLQEGLDFMEKISSNGHVASDFYKLRSDLRGIVKAKLKNVQKGNSLFKKKLGGNKKNPMNNRKKFMNR